MSIAERPSSAQVADYGKVASGGQGRCPWTLPKEQAPLDSFTLLDSLLEES